MLAEFGDTRTRRTRSTERRRPCTDGPLHNEIPKPNRKVDNSTVWQKNYSRSHYDGLYFDRMKKFYEQQSSGTYSIAGDVTAWVKVPFNERRYGSDSCGSIICSNVWFLVRDALAGVDPGPHRRGLDDVPDPGLPEDVRQAGPLRLRRRR